MEKQYLRKCVVEGCFDQTSIRHKFPAEIEVRRIWIERVGNDALQNYRDTQLSTTYICGAHFVNECRGKRYLLGNALPTINMPGFHGEANIANSFYNKALCTSLYQKSVTPTPSTSQFVLSNEASTSQVHGILSENIHVANSGPSKIRKRSLMSLTKEEQDLYKFGAYYRKKFQRLSRKLSSSKKQKQYLERFSSSEILSKLEAKLSPTIYKFLLSQYSTFTKMPKGRRFTIDDKILAISIYKTSPKCYRLLRNIFSLPSVRTLRRLLHQIPFLPGINVRVFNHLRSVVTNLTEKDKYCTIIFDEMALHPGLSYNKYRNYIEGFVCYGDSRVCRLADHALVFMAQGVFRRWKQPLAFIFCEGATPTSQLMSLIKLITRNVIDCGLIPVATVCDQGASNRAAINKLLQETQVNWRRQGKEFNGVGFEVNGQEIVPLFDYPHLLKCIRNNLLTKDLIYTFEGVKKSASWSYLLNLYNWDEPTKYFNVFTKLTDYHVIPNKIKKMKVSYCTQVFSQRVGKLMQCLIDSGSLVVPKEAEGTATLFLFLNDLFDSCNGSRKFAQGGHELRCRISSNSGHLAFWKKARNIVESMYFVSPVTKTISRPPSLKNWVHTLKGLEYLWTKFSTLSFEYMIPRNFNQDGLENFFSSVRSHGVRNVNPTCELFITSFKTLIINNFMSSKSVSSNCESDFSTGALNNLHSFILHNVQPVELPETNIILQKEVISKRPPIYLESYISGYVAKQLFKNIGQCKTCINNMTMSEEVSHHLLIVARRYSHKSLLLPSTKFMLIFKECSSHIAEILPKICLNNHLSNMIVKDVLSYINFDDMYCSIHQNVCEDFVNILTNLMIFSWIKSINRIVSGRDTRFKKSNNDDFVKMLAYEKSLKRIKNF